MKKVSFVSFYMSVACLLLAGCAAMGGVSKSPTAKLAVQYAVLKYIGGEPDKAARVESAVGKALMILDEDASTTVAALKTAVIASIDFASLEPADQILASGVIDAVAIELTERIGDGQLQADAILQVQTVLLWVTDAARLAAAGAT